jgi:hypothetical protein
LSAARRQLAAVPFVLGQPVEAGVPVLPLRPIGQSTGLVAAAQRTTVYDAALDLCSRFKVDPPRLTGRGREDRR